MFYCAYDVNRFVHDDQTAQGHRHPPALACVRIPHPYVMRMRISLHPSPTYNSLTILGFPGLLRLSVCTQVKCQESGLMSRVELSVYSNWKSAYTVLWCVCEWAWYPAYWAMKRQVASFLQYPHLQQLFANSLPTGGVKEDKGADQQREGAGTGERQDISRTAAQEEDEPCNRDISVHPGLRRGPH